MASRPGPLSERLAWRSLRAACRLATRRIDLRVEGLDHLPATGPVMLVARHFHHFWDGCALLAVIPRPLHIVVALDWLRQPVLYRLLASACRMAGWPIVTRSEDHTGRDHRAADLSQLRTATRECVSLLRARRPLLLFPEGYPNIDPSFTPKPDDTTFLPFKPGFARFVAIAERDGRTQVPIVPVGLDYSRGERWRLTVRFGPPIAWQPDADCAEQVRAIEARVRRLSGLVATGQDEVRAGA